MFITGAEERFVILRDSEPGMSPKLWKDTLAWWLARQSRDREE